MTNRQIMKEINMKESTFYALKKRNPRLIDLLKKGMTYERNLRIK